MAAAPLEAAALMKEYVMVPPETSKPSQPIGSAVPHSRSPRGGRAAQAGMGHQAKASNEHRGVGLGRGNVRGQAQSPRQRGGGHNVRGAPHIRGAAQARGRGVNGVRGRGVGAGRGGQVGRGGPRRPAPVRAGGRGGRGRGAGVVPRGKRPQANAQGRGLAMGEGVGRERAAVTAMMSEKKQTARGGQSTGMRERGQRNTVEKQTHSGNSCDAPAVSRGAEKSRHSDAPPTDAREEAAIQTPTQLPQERATGPPLDGRHTEHQLMRVQESQPPTGPLQASEIQRTTAREQCSAIGEREHSPFGTLASSELIGSSPRVAPLPQRVVSALPVPTEPAPLPPTFEKGQSAPQIVRKKKVPPHSGEGHIIAAAVPSRPPRRELSRNKSEEHLSGAVLSPCEQDGTLAQEEVVPSPVFTMLPPEDSLATPEGSSVRGEENTVGDSERADAGEESAGGQGDSDAVPFSFWESRVQPAFLYETMSFVHKHALGVEGVFRISASTARIAELKVAEKEGTLTAEFEKCKETDNGVLAVADFMNKHFQDSPLPLVPVHVFQEICQSVDVPEPETVREELRGLIYNMPEVSLSVFCALLNIAYDASLQCETTKMHAGNLAICIGPNIMYDPTPTLDVVAVRKEAGLMTSSLAEFIKDFPQIFEDVRSGTWREKGTPYAARLAVRLQAAAEVPGTPEPSPHQQVKKKKSKGVMPSFLKKKLKSATSYAPSKPDTEFMLRRRASCVHEPTTDDKEKHRMLQAMSVKLVDMDPSEICLLSFHQVRETLVEAEFPETSIDSHEKFLKTAILTLVTNLHSG